MQINIVTLTCSLRKLCHEREPAGGPQVVAGTVIVLVDIRRPYNIGTLWL